MSVPYIAPEQIAEHTGDYEAAGLSAPPARTDEDRHPIRDFAVVAALICLAIFI